MRRVLITGGDGLVGSATVDAFLSREDNVTSIDNHGRSEFFGVKQEGNSLNIDIRDYSTLEELFRAKRPEVVVHAAAQPSHDWASDHPFMDFEVNARGTLNLLELTRQYVPEATFIHVSTDKVYGENMVRELTELETRYHSDFPFTESLGLDFAGNRSLFGCSKTAADVYAQEYGNYFGIRTVIFRPGCITGRHHAGAEQHGFLAYLAECVREKKPYTIFGYKGKQVRDQIHASDLAQAFLLASQRPPNPGTVYNMGGGAERSISVLEAIEAFEKIEGKEAIIKYAKERKGDRQWDVHDTTKFQEAYPEWEMKYDLQDIINDVYGV